MVDVASLKHHPGDSDAHSYAYVLEHPLIRHPITDVSIGPEAECVVFSCFHPCVFSFSCTLERFPAWSIIWFPSLSLLLCRSLLCSSTCVQNSELYIFQPVDAPPTLNLEVCFCLQSVRGGGGGWITPSCMMMNHLVKCCKMLFSGIESMSTPVTIACSRSVDGARIGGRMDDSTTSR